MQQEINYKTMKSDSPSLHTKVINLHHRTYTHLTPSGYSKGLLAGPSLLWQENVD